ncbi:hypothetical protein [Streptomyces sp. NBC_01477]|uniref:hypothetical protein n=1 Tax=Streptomyces sp. NBC_01477 TaxID=2976015 RepID=UPI002E3328E8|nr:hypothetical protein [Streptomyces sp. NBC_01477]
MDTRRVRIGMTAAAVLVALGVTASCDNTKGGGPAGGMGRQGAPAAKHPRPPSSSPPPAATPAPARTAPPAATSAAAPRN